MVILPEHEHPYIIESVTGPVIPKHAWYYDAGVNDFMLKPILMLEETTGPAVKLRANGVELFVPSSWHIMIADDETKTVDTVSIGQCANSAYKAFMMHPRLNRFELCDVQLLDFILEMPIVHLMIPRLTMICHPVGKTSGSKNLAMSILLGPQDVGKNMNNVSAMELLI